MPKFDTLEGAIGSIKSQSIVVLSKKSVTKLFGSEADILLDTFTVVKNVENDTLTFIDKETDANTGMVSYVPYKESEIFNRIMDKIEKEKIKKEEEDKSRITAADRAKADREKHGIIKLSDYGFQDSDTWSVTPKNLWYVIDCLKDASKNNMTLDMMCEKFKIRFNPKSRSITCL